MHGNGVAGADAAVYPDVRTLIGKNEMADRADRRQEIVRRVFGINPGLDGVAVYVEILPALRQCLTIRNTEPAIRPDPGR